MGLALGLALGSAALDLVGGMQQQGQARTAQNRAKRQLKKRRRGPEAQMLREIFAKQSKDLKELPGVLKRAREGRISTASQQRKMRFERALAASGASQASTAGMLGDRNIVEGIERMNREGELAERGAVDQARARAANTGMSLQNAMYASPGQLQQTIDANDAFYNPLSAVGAGMSGYFLGDALSNEFGGGGGNGGPVRNASQYASSLPSYNSGAVADASQYANSLPKYGNYGLGKYK